MPKSRRAKASSSQPRPAPVEPLRLAGDFCERGRRHLAEGRIAAAIRSCQVALIIAPDGTGAHLLLCRLPVPAVAPASWHRALYLEPDNAEIHNNFAVHFSQQTRHQQARRHYILAIIYNPALTSPYFNLGNTEKSLDNLDEASTSYHRAAALSPQHKGALCNLGITEKDLSNAEQACSLLEKALLLDGHDLKIFQYLLGTSLYRADIDNTRLEALHKRFAAACRPPEMSPTAFPPPEPGRRLRIGYLSSDFRRHPMAKSLLPMVQAHDRTLFSVHFFSHQAYADDVTEEYRKLADGWCDITHLSDRQAAERIRRDCIDILVLLAGRFDENRPTIACHRAAPIQISLYDVATSGLDGMDYFIGDRRLTPRNGAEYFSERVLRLPTFQAVALPEDLPAIADQHRDGPVFACFNNPSKITPTALAAWGEILARRPKARLTLKYLNRYASGSLRQRFLDRLTAAGANREQIEFVTGWDTEAALMARYNGVDAALDTFPFSGSTTSAQALAMGVPVVTWPGEHMASRWTASMLETLKLNGLIARSREDYVAVAVKTADDAGHWRTFRGALRRRLMESPLVDTARRTRQMERFYRAVWHLYCRDFAGKTEQSREPADARWSVVDNPADSHGYHALGEHYQNARNFSQALLTYRRSLLINATSEKTLNDVGTILLDMGKHDEATTCFKSAIAYNCKHFESLNNIANCFKYLGKIDESKQSYWRAFIQNWNSAETIYNLGLLLKDLGELETAVCCTKAALALRPDIEEIQTSLGVALLDQGKPGEAAPAFETTLRLAPNHATAFRYLLVSSLYRDDQDNAQVEHLHRRFAEAFPDADDHHTFPTATSRGHRQIRIGYLSSDLFHHPVTDSLLPLVRHHDRSAFSLFFYALGRGSDAVTRELHALADGWRNIAHLDDRQAAQCIRADGIDILVLLAGHFDKNRPTVAPYRAAPVQISLYDVATSGLSGMDYFIGDGLLTPRHSSEYFSERILRLPFLPASQKPPFVSRS